MLHLTMNLSPRYVIANDLSPLATAAMKRNVDLNGLGERTVESDTTEADEPEKVKMSKLIPGKVRINEGDARCVYYFRHRSWFTYSF